MATPYSGASVPQEQVSSLEQRLISIESDISDLAYLLSISSDEANQIANIDDSVFVTARWAFLAGLAIDDYYTEDEVDSLLDDKANADETVNLVGNQEVDGIKTFTSSPIVPVPTTDYQIAPKVYVDEKIEYARDLLINGNMRWWQRGTSFTNPANGVYTADRWKIIRGEGSGVSPNANIALETSYDIYHYMTITITAGGTLGASMWAGVNQTYEFWTSMLNKTVSLRARVLAPAGRTFRIQLYNGVSASYLESTGTGDWQELVLENYSVGASGVTTLYASFMWANGTSFIPQNGDVFKIDRMQLTEGATALPFLPYDNIIDYKKCIRYYEKSYNYADAPGTASATGSVNQWCQVANVYVLNLSAQFSVSKRTTPSMIWYSNDRVVNYIGVYGSSNIAVSSEAHMSEKKTGCPVLASAPTVGQLLIAHWVADAEI